MKKAARIVLLALLTCSTLQILVACESKEVKVNSLLKSSESYMVSRDYKQIQIVYDKLQGLGDNKPLIDKLNGIVEKNLSDSIDHYINNKEYDQALGQIDKISKRYSHLDADFIGQAKTKILSRKQSNDNFVQDMDLFNNKMYDEAAVKFSRVIKEDTDNFSAANEKIKEISDIKFNDYVGQAKSAFDKRNYPDALLYIDKALSIKNDSTALELKKSFIDAQEKQKNEGFKNKEDKDKQNAAFESKNDQERFINSLSISSRTKYLIYVDMVNEKTEIFRGYKNHWTLYKDWLCSTGIGAPDDRETGTLTGQFTIRNRGKWFYSEKYQEGAEYWTQFYGNWLFHSLPMDRKHVVLKNELGKPASHGCVQLTIENARWIHDNIPSGTKVFIPRPDQVAGK